MSSYVGKEGSMWARVTAIQGSPDRVKSGIHHFRDQFIPVARGLPGFRGAYLLVDRKTGKFVGISLWETERELRASEVVSSRLRAQGGEALGTTESPLVEVYEVVVQPD